MSLLRAHLVDVVLLVLAAAAAAGVVATNDTTSSGELISRRRHVVQDYAVADVVRLEFEKGKEKVVVERRPADAGEGAGEFVMTAPRQGDIEPAPIERLLRALDLATVLRRVPPETVDRARFGLTSPRRVVTVATKRQSTRLVVGSPAPSPKGAVYLEVSGTGVAKTGVVIVKGALARDLDLGLNDLRERTIVPFGLSQIAALDVTVSTAQGDRRLRLSRRDHRFLVGKGETARLVDRDVMDAIGLQLARTRAEAFVAADKATAAQKAAPRRVAVRVTPRSGMPLEIVLGGPCPGTPEDVLVQRRSPEPVTACVPAAVEEALAAPRAQLLDRSAFGLHVDEVERLTLARPDRRFELVRRGHAFRLLSPAAGDVPLDAGNGRVRSVVATPGRLLDADDEAGAQKAGGSSPLIAPEPPAVEVEVTSTAGSDDEVQTEAATLREFREDGSAVLIRKLDKARLHLSSEQVRAFLPDATLLRDPEVLSLQVSSLRAVTVTFDDFVQRVERSDGGAFSLVKPPGHDVDGPMASDLFGTVGDLRTDRWLADADDGTFGLDEPRVDVVIEATKGRRYHLRVGRRVAGGHAATVEPGGGVFVLDRLVAERLATLLLRTDRFALRTGLHRRDATATLIRGPERLTIERSGAGYRLRGGSGAVLPADVEVIAQHLTGLRALAATHLGKARSDEGFGDPVLELEYVGEVGDRRRRVVIGAGDVWRGNAVHHVRVDGVEATFVVPRGPIREILRRLP